MYMLYMQCYVHMVLCACCTCGAMYICGVCMILHVVLCTFSVVYMLYTWYHVQVMLCTCHACDIVYMWCCIHVVHVVL